MKNFTFFLLACMGLCLFSCMPDKIDPVDPGRDYYPLFDGKFLTYQVDSIIFDDGLNGNNVKDTLRSVIKEEFVNPQLNEFGDTIYQLKRYWKPEGSNSFKLTNQWSTNNTTFEAIRQEGNLRFQVFDFPIKDSSRWDITTYFDNTLEFPIGTELVEVYQFWNSEITSFDISDEIGQFSFTDGSVLIVSHADRDDPIALRKVTEKYVRNLGLVYKEMSILDTKCDTNPIDCEGLEWDEKGIKGFKLIQTLIDHN